jgi:hypothetical protein
MSGRRGLRIIDLMIGVVLMAVVGLILKEPRLRANPMDQLALLRNGSLRRDPTFWLCPAAISTVALVLASYSIGSRLTIGRSRTFLEASAIGGWFYFVLAFSAKVDSQFSHAFLPIGRADEYSLTNELTGLLQGIPNASSMCMIG